MLDGPTLLIGTHMHYLIVYCHYLTSISLMMPSSVICRRAVRMQTVISAEHISYIFRVKNQQGKKQACSRWLGALVSCYANFRPWE
jgi:hypothetical protein